MEPVRKYVSSLHLESTFPLREDVGKSVGSPNRVTPPTLSIYETTMILGVRVQQLSKMASPLVSTEGLDTESQHFFWDVAKREMLQHRLPFILARELPNGDKEFWALSELQEL